MFSSVLEKLCNIFVYKLSTGRHTDFIATLHQTPERSPWNYSCCHFVMRLPPKGALITPLVSCYGDGLHLRGKRLTVLADRPPACRTADWGGYAWMRTFLCLLIYWLPS